MRIRKRKVPLPLSLLSPIPLSDPHLFSRSPVHLHHQPQPSDHFSPTSAPSDLRPLIVFGNSTNPSSSGVKQEEDKDEQRSCLEFQGGGERIAQKSNNDNDDGASKEEVEVAVEAVNNNGAVGVSLSNEGGMGRWSEGERVIPLKKRRPSESFFEKDVYDNGEEKTAVANSYENNNNNKKGSGNKQKRGTTIMEGSRCSRVSGRGWRCCQPTLVGYSLCEHHLGKGRLRSMTSVRGRPSSKKQHHMVKNNHHDQEKQQASKRANYKLGVVKARSLSSLLGQTTSMTTITTSTTTTNSDSNVGHDISSISISNLES